MAPTPVAATKKKTHPALKIAASAKKAPVKSATTQPAAAAAVETPLRKPRRRRQGGLALATIKTLANSKDRIIKYSPFANSVKNFLSTNDRCWNGKDSAIQRTGDGMELLMWAVQEVGVSLFAEAQRIALLMGDVVPQEKHLIAAALQDPKISKYVFEDPRLSAMVYAQKSGNRGVYL